MAIFQIQFKVFIQDSRSLLSLNSHLNNEILKATTVRCTEILNRRDTFFFFKKCPHLNAATAILHLEVCILRYHYI